MLPPTLAAALALPVLTAVALPDTGADTTGSLTGDLRAPAAVAVADEADTFVEPDALAELDLDAMPFLDEAGEYDPVGDASIIDDPLPLEHVVMGEDHHHDTDHEGHGDADATTAASAGGASLPSTRRPLACEPNGGFRTVVVYAHLRGQRDDRRSHLGNIRSTMERSNQMLARSAVTSGGPVADLRTRCTSGGAVSVASVEVTSRDFGQIKQQMAQQGLNNRHEKYLIFADFGHGTRNIAGLADLFHDTRRSVHNHNNGNHAMYGVVYGSRHFGGSVALHELAHTMGAAQRGAPRADGSGHCTWSGDLLCRGGASGIVLDRGNDTYFSTNTRSGQWLHHHWNLGWEGNRFVRVAGRPGPNLAPTAVLTADCERATCVIDARDSSDPDGQIARYQLVVDGERISGRVVRHTFAENGTYEATVTVTDDRGATDTTTRSLRVSGATAPTPRASISCDELTCTLDGTGSDDRDGGSIEGHRWRLPDGRTSTRPVWTVTFEESGRHQVELTVTDDDGWTGRTTATARPGASTVPGTDALDDPGRALTDTVTSLSPQVDLDPPNLPSLDTSVDLRLGDVGVDLEVDGLRPRLKLDLGGKSLGLLG